jgi:hypothetical protein
VVNVLFGKYWLKFEGIGFDLIKMHYLQVSLGRRNILKITVKNIGHRAAFVKAVCYAGKVRGLT